VKIEIFGILKILKMLVCGGGVDLEIKKETLEKTIRGILGGCV